MGRLLIAMSLAACTPGLEFEVVDGAIDASRGDGGSDAGDDGGSDATDAGVDAPAGNPLSGCATIFDCVRTCDDAIFDGIALDPDFDEFPASLTRVSGEVDADGTDLVFTRHMSDPFSTVRSTSAVRDMVLCAQFRQPGGGDSITTNLFAIGFLTGMGGIELFMDGREGELSLKSAEVLPDGVLLSAREHVWETPHEFVVVVYLAGTVAYAEVFDTVADARFVLRGTYGGEQEPGFGWLSVGEVDLEGAVVVSDLRIGTPSAEARAIMER